MTDRSRAALALAAWLTTAACVDETQGVRSGATCPPSNAPTYQGFAGAFFAGYCLDCHSETRQGDDRRGAPEHLNFDTAAMIRTHAPDIDRMAAAGDNAQNRLMPPLGHPPYPTDFERASLGQYLACELAR